MLLTIARVIFVLLGAGLGFGVGREMALMRAQDPLASVDVMASGILAGGIGAGVSAVVISLEFLITKRLASVVPILIFGVLFGLVAGSLFVQPVLMMMEMAGQELGKDVQILLQVLTTCIFAYLGGMIVMQTRNDLKFIIPYVEFAKQEKGARPLVLDTSVIIDGRIADVCETSIIDEAVVVPRFILKELQAIADSSDRMRRNRGRRGLDMLKKMQDSDKITLEIHESTIPGTEDVDAKLVKLAKSIGGRVATNDYNLSKIALIEGVETININDLANALKPAVIPGEHMMVSIMKAGEEPGQGVGYLDDGTMVVVENARDRIGAAFDIVITSTLQTSAGRMIFGRPQVDS